MPVTATIIGASANTANSTAYTSASVNRGANKLRLLAIANSDATDATVPSSVTGGGSGSSWTQIATRGYNTGATPLKRISLFRSLSATTGSGTLTINFPSSNVQTGCAWSLVEFANVSTTGTNGAGAVVQSASTFGDASTQLTVTLAAFASTANATYGAFSNNGSGAGEFNVGAGFSTLANLGYATPNVLLGAEWKNSNDTTVNATGNGSNAWAGIAVEIRFATTAAPVASRRLPVVVVGQAVNRAAVI